MRASMSNCPGHGTGRDSIPVEIQGINVRRIMAFVAGISHCKMVRSRDTDNVLVVLKQDK